MSVMDLQPWDEPCGPACVGRYLVVPRPREDGVVRFYAYDNADVEAHGMDWRAIRFARDGWPAVLHAMQLVPCRAELLRAPASWPGDLPPGLLSDAELSEFVAVRAQTHRRILAHEVRRSFADEPEADDAPLVAPPAATPRTLAQGDLFS